MEGKTMANQQEAQKKMLARWFEEVWNQEKREAIDEMFPSDCVLYDGRAKYRGPDEFKHFYDGIRAQLSGIQGYAAQNDLGRGHGVCEMVRDSKADQHRQALGSHRHELPKVQGRALFRGLAELGHAR